MTASAEAAVYRRQGFGKSLGMVGQPGLLIVDFVNGFADPAAFGGGNISEAIARTLELLLMARKLDWPVAHTRIVFAKDGADANVFSMKVPSLLKLTEDNPQSAFVDTLRPVDGELVVRKTAPSAFSGTNLSAWLSARGARTLVIAGCVTSGCVRASVVDAMSLGFRPLVISDCVGDRAIGPHEANLFDIAQKYADVLDFDTLTRLVSNRNA